VVGVTADTNIYVSALLLGGSLDALLDVARARDIKLYISDDVTAELAHVLRDKFRWTEEAVKLTIERVGDFTERVEPKQAVDAIREDPSDNRSLGCAVASASDYVVTGDKHLLKLGKFAESTIVKAAEFIGIRGQIKRAR
jgi:putative PIN family toxin of toxin-antitoxin system